MIQIFILFLLLFSFRLSEAATINAASCSQADVQTAINTAANSGDTVAIPAGACTWTSAITLNSISTRTKMIKLLGAGTSATTGTRITANFSGNPIFNFWLTHTIGPLEISNIRFIQGSSWGNGDEEAVWAIALLGHADTFPSLFRIHHIVFVQATGNIVNSIRIGGLNTYGTLDNGHPFIWGVIDHNDWTGTVSFQAIDILPIYSHDASGATVGGGNAGNLAWRDYTITDHQGTWMNVFIEDNTATATQWGNSQAWLDGSGGSAYVARYNTLRNNWFTNHGADSGFRSSRWMEIYNNKLIIDTTLSGFISGNDNRGGPGVLWGNSYWDAAHKGTGNPQNITGTQNFNNPAFVEYYRADQNRGGDYVCGSLKCNTDPVLGCDNKDDGTGWICRDQIGATKGASQPTWIYGYAWATHPYMEWANYWADTTTHVTFNLNTGDMPSIGNYVKGERDMIRWNDCSNGVDDDGVGGTDMADAQCVTFWDPTNNKKLGYTPYTYPHPLVASVPSVGTKVAFTRLPAGCTGGVDCTTQPIAVVQDDLGNTITNDNTTQITISMAVNPGGGTLTCANMTVTVIAGVANFFSCKIDKVGTGYALRVSAPSLVSGDSGFFSVTAGPAVKLGYTTQPGGGVAGNAWSQQPVVVTQDAGGNTTIPVASNTPAYVNGVQASRAGSGGALTTSAITTSNSFFVAAVTWDSGSVSMTFSDSKGGTWAAATSQQTDSRHDQAMQMFYCTNCPSGSSHTFTATPSVNTCCVRMIVHEVSGIATSSPLDVTAVVNNEAGTAVQVGPITTTVANEYIFAVGENDSGSGTWSAVSPFTERQTASAGSSEMQSQDYIQPSVNSITPQWTLSNTDDVIAQVAAFKPTSGGGEASVTLAIGTNPGSGTLSCTTNPLTTSSGVASFAGCSINNAGNGYTLTAAATGLTTGTSSAFNITSGASNKLVFTTTPSGATGGLPFPTQAVVAVQDSSNNTITSDNSTQVTLAISTNPSSGTLTCDVNPVTVVAGIATFNQCRIDKAGTGYVLQATATGLTTGNSSSFNVAVGSATKLGFTTQPGGGTGGTSWSTQPVVAVQDPGGNTITSSTASIVLTISANPGSGTLSCTQNPKDAVSGVVTYSGCNIDKAGTAYTIQASSSGLSSALSVGFNVTVGSAALLKFTVQPGGGPINVSWNVQPVVTVYDAGLNIVTGASNSVTLNVSGGGNLTCDLNPKTPISGLVSFTGCRVDTVGVKSLTAIATGLTSDTSSSFTISSGTACTQPCVRNPGTSGQGNLFGGEKGP